MMMKTIMKPAGLMVETAVDLMSIQISASNVFALKEMERAVEELHLPVARGGLGMVYVMIITIFLNATTMVEIAVDLMLIQINAQYVNALKKEGVVKELQHLLVEAAIRVGLLICIVMISTTI